MNTVIQNFVRDRVYEMSDNYHKEYILDMIVSTLFAQTPNGSLYDFLCSGYTNSRFDLDQDNLFLQLEFLKNHIDENPSVFSGLFINQDWTPADDEEEDDE